MDKILAYSDQFHLFELQHIHTLANGISIGYIISMVYSIILAFILPAECVDPAQTAIKSITYFIYISTLVATLGRTIMS